MTVFEVGQKLVELCRQNKNMEAVKELYSPEIVSVEAGGPPGVSPETKGLSAVEAKNKGWLETHEIHSATAEGPYPNGNRFVVHFQYDITNKPTQRRMQLDEMGLYTVEGDRIVREEFFYHMG